MAESNNKNFSYKNVDILTRYINTKGKNIQTGGKKINTSDTKSTESCNRRYVKLC